MAVILEKIDKEIKMHKAAIDELRIAFDIVNDTNRVLEQVEIAREITRHATLLENLVKLRKLVIEKPK